jgi:hypothetical protein
MITHRPAPWRLRGEAFILLYRFPRDFVEAEGSVPAELAGRFVGGTGAVMMVSYQESEVGPHQELLFIPGKFRVGGSSYFAVTKIYSSSPLAVDGGRRNWGLPKELAEFSIERDGGEERVAVTLGQQTVVELAFRPGRLGLPVTTDLISAARRTLVQPLDGELYLTAPEGRGSLRRMRLIESIIDGSRFPNFAQQV